MMHRVPVSPANCTVLGNRVKATDAAWAGLDLARADLLAQSTLWMAIAGQDAPLDLHLNVPWCHPDDQTGSPDDFDCRYRVRPKMEPGKKWKRKLVKNVAFERWDGQWWIAVETA